MISHIGYDYILASFPRSGNHWVRYIIEFFSKRPTVGCGGKKWSTEDDGPLFEKLGKVGYYKELKPIVKKRHYIQKEDIDKNLILIIRDPLECIVRQGLKGNFPKFTNIMIPKLSTEYCDLIRQFDTWKKKKCLIYYEDLLLNINSIIKKVLEFLDIQKYNIKDLTDNLDYHKKISINYYVNTAKSPSHTKGNTISHHINRIDNATQELLTNKIKTTLSMPLYNKYLKRYRK